MYEKSVNEALKKDVELPAYTFFGEEVTIPATKCIQFFTSKAQIPLNEHNICIPMKCNKRTLNCFKGNWLFQITHQLTHSLNERGLEDIFNAIGNNESYNVAT